MQSIQSVRRDKLYRLRETVTNDDDFTRTLEQDNVVPSSFLNQNGIILLDYDIEETDADRNLAHDSPVLFRPASLDFFKRYPIDVNGFDSPIERKDYMRYRKYNPGDGREDVPQEFWPKEFVGAVANYLKHWATGIFPRQLPDSVHPRLPDNYGIRKPLYEISTPS